MLEFFVKHTITGITQTYNFEHTMLYYDFVKELKKRIWEDYRICYFHLVPLQQDKNFNGNPEEGIPIEMFENLSLHEYFVMRKREKNFYIRPIIIRELYHFTCNHVAKIIVEI